MPIDFAGDLAVAFRESDGAVAAIITPKIGDGRPVTILRTRADALADGFGGARLKRGTFVFNVQTAECADLADGYTIDILDADGVTVLERFAVQGSPLLDEDRLQWTAEARQITGPEITQ